MIIKKIDLNRIIAKMIKKLDYKKEILIKKKVKTNI